MPHATEPRRTQKVSERIALDIVQDIVAQGLGVGDRLPLEAAMVEHYEASRASVREALRLLEVQGLIRLRPGPGGGPVVGSVAAGNLARTATLYFHLRASTYRELFETQVLLEPIVAQLAADHADRQLAMKPFTDPDSPAEAVYRHQTTNFHEAVYQLAANPVLALLTSAVTHTVSDHMTATMDPVERRLPIPDEHRAIARAIAAGQADRAHRLMEAHFQAQYDLCRIRCPSRLHDLIKWR